ncbi:MAG: hypothetical protein GXN93_00040 [Candidatus Diapherotrites archaeon]|nr:hypothetical protein [Candidatus Diapherotrites archaeon]
MGVPEKFLSVAEKLRELGATNIEIAYVWDRTKENEGYRDDAKIHAALKEINPELAERFFKEMRIKVWRTDFRREHFNRRRIVESLLRETKITRGLAEKIAREVEEKIRSTDASIITSPLIRELVLARLIEMGMTEEYSRYMRLGIPVYDLEKAMEKGDVEDRVLDKILEQYVLFEVLPQGAVELLLDGVWRIEGMRRPHKPYARTFILRTPSRKTWLRGLAKYLSERDYVDTPSVNIPRNMADDGTVMDVVDALKDFVIFWSEADVPGAKRSEIPVYSFGKVDAKVVADVIRIDAAKISESVSSLQAMERTVETISEGIEKYRAFKERFVKRGEFLIFVEGIDTAAKNLMADRKKIAEVFLGLKPFQLA